MERNQLLYHSKVSKIRFSLAGDEGIKKDSFVAVMSHDLFSNNLPYNGGVYDAHMGTTDHSYKCQTCFRKKKHCLGHPGHINLNYPVWSPMALSDGKKWLQVICFECGNIVIDDAKFANVPGPRKLAAAADAAKLSKDKFCVHCRAERPTLSKNDSSIFMLNMSYVNHSADRPKQLMPREAGEILSRVSDETVRKLGKSPLSHPRNIILHVIQVPPVTIRPDVKKVGGLRSTNDELTTMLQLIVKKNNSIPASVQRHLDSTRREAAETAPSNQRLDAKKVNDMYIELNNAYYDFVYAKGEGSTPSLASRQKGKSGRQRKNQMGKRVVDMCRSTITNNPRIRIDEVGVPIKFARIIQFEEVVQEFNKARLMQYVLNGRARYPGASKIIKRGREYNIDSFRDIELENGDVILRDMIDGDPVNFNRQPSLMISNISTHRARIILDESVNVIQFNVLACKAYNADFDGDQMNLIISSSIATRNEIDEISGLHNWLISHTTSSPLLGQADDSIIGTAELTRSRTVFDKYHAMLLFRNTTILPRFDDVKRITGREVISMTMEATPINFSRVSEWYKQDMTPFINYDPTETHVSIKRGKLVNGVLDKKSIGSGSNGGIYHLIANEYGSKKALEVMFNMQQMAIEYIMQFGYTIGLKDIAISAEAQREASMITADIINKSNLITDELMNGEIIPPIGKTIDGFFEERQINTLLSFDAYTETILKSIDPETNNLFKLIMFGSKGKLEHMYNMVSTVGQKLINGERIRQRFGFKRTLAYFPRFDNSPEARGYITNSYLKGMNSTEYIFNAMAARFDLISKALSTSITGEQNRKSIKNLESAITNNFRAMTKNKNIVQFAYGEDFLDPRFVERVRFPTIMISDAEFEKTYKSTGFDDFFARMKKDRDEYRRIFFQFENMNIREVLSDERKMPVNIARIIENVLYAARDGETTIGNNKKTDNKSTGDDLAAKVGNVVKFCQTLPYLLLNEIQEEAGSEIPAVIKSSCWLMKVLIRSYLHPEALREISTDNLMTILDKIRLTFGRALVSPGTGVGIITAQSFSEPLTQYMLDAHHRSALGGTSKNTMVSAKEVLGARAVDKLRAPSMRIPILPEYAENEAKVQEYANNIEMMTLQQFVSLVQIFYESFGHPVHDKYKHEEKMFPEFAKRNPLLAPPGDLTRWCVRMIVNKAALIIKNMPLELIVSRLRETFPDIYVVYTPENAEQIVMRIYISTRMSKDTITVATVEGWVSDFLDTVIRGVRGIKSATATKFVRSKINEDGSITRDENRWGIVTNGTNLIGVMKYKFVDRLNIFTDAIQEVKEIFGIEAARQKVISEIRALVDICNHRYYLVYADEMTFTGNVTSIDSTGLKARENNNIMLRIGTSSPIPTMEDAATNARQEVVSGITTPLLIGTTPKIGTLYNSFHINGEFVKKHVKRPDDIVDALFN